MKKIKKYPGVKQIAFPYLHRRVRELSCVLCILFTSVVGASEIAPKVGAIFDLTGGLKHLWDSTK